LVVGGVGGPAITYDAVLELHAGGGWDLRQAS